MRLKTIRHTRWEKYFTMNGADMMTTMTIENAEAKVEFKKGDVLRTALTEEPGAGAVKFAKWILEAYDFVGKENYRIKLTTGDYYEIADMFRANGGINIVGSRMEYSGVAIDVARTITYGDLQTDRIKRCHFCGYFYWDITKNNSSHVCSPECKTGKDNVLRKYRRQVRNADKPKRKLLKDEHYSYEYSFFESDYWMREYDRRHQAYSYGDNFEAVVGYHQVAAKNGGKRVKVPQKIEYNGTEKVKSIYVKSPRYDKSIKTASKVKSFKMSRKEIEGHLLESYGAQKLAYERRFAQLHSIGKAY